MFLAYDYPLLSAFWTMLWFFLWIMWFFLLFKIVFDIFRDDSLGGWGKTGWLVFVIVLPFLGVFVYLIARGKDMGRRDIEQAQAQKQMFDSYVRETAATSRPSSTDELARLAELRKRGDITQEEFQRAKALILSDARPANSDTPVRTPSSH
ncbi:SHOCT domain-containing protein [Streptomyces collinus]|uniref:Integral membrane protein n=1 Tax=Streptomyces collinus (strain DSM 40733 / Tue 365) TaxID=1214242 RepID=S5UX51_STRC3|nr:SHOCT domain-containing protein [Streptomyces collinus]AGS70366.1 integral membrane protein [Streptomyces collinus Tu 365]UJA09013.1 integral membrane protein [Streptomyces collinus]UJA16123.1 integral membrane protein [Streptomyces collinus]